MKKGLIAWFLAFFIGTITTGCLSQIGLNYALRRDVTKDSTRYASDLTRNTRGWGANAEWSKKLRDTIIVSEQDGVKLHAIYRRADQPTDRTVIVLHGYGGNAPSMMPIARFYSEEMKCNVLMPDFYAHGQSEGKMRRMGWRDRLDMMQWMRLANDLFRGDKSETRMMVTGVSMGGATTMMVSGEVEQAGMTWVKCLVEDCGYTTVWDEFGSVLKGKRWVLPLGSRRCKHRYGWGFKEASAVEAVKHCSLPMMFIHGGNDTFVPTNMVNKVYEAKQGTKELWIPAEIGHGESFYRVGREYKQRVKAFMEKYL